MLKLTKFKFVYKKIKSRNYLVLILTFFFSSLSLAQKSKDSHNLDVNLSKAGANRSQLVKVLSYFKTVHNPLKLEAAKFLIANMDIHYSSDYYLLDSLNKRVKFDEFSYPSYDSAFNAMLSLQKKTGFHLKEVIYPDLQYIKASYLINHINRSFSVWESSLFSKISFKDFCEYVLPYRSTFEPIQEWHEKYNVRYKWISDSLKNTSYNTVLSYIAADYRNWFTFTFGKNARVDPLPRLGAMQLLFRKKGACEDVADLEVFTLRSQGIPVSFNFIPLWGTSTGTHFLNTAFDTNMKPVRFDVTMQPEVNRTLPREPAKVIRITYSKQLSALVNFEKFENIPPGFMQTHNYIDATNEYWETSDVKCKVFGTNKSTAFACVINGGTWLPVWWGKINIGEALFTNMPKGVVYLPAFYKNGVMVPAGYPKVNGYNNEVVLKPDMKIKREIVIKEQEKFLKFQSTKKYSLYYWDNDWKLVSEQIALEGAKELTFANAPSNALFVIVPEYSKGLERPFIITVEGDRYWF